MHSIGRFAGLVGALVVVAGLAGSASAQITTGVLAGTVKDAQGGVVPGATVTLISDTQATKSAPVVTSGTGDFVFPNVRDGHVHRRSGVARVQDV